MLEPFLLTTCLSSTVQNMVCKLGFEIQDHFDIRKIVNEENKVCWSNLCENIVFSGQDLDYAQSVRQLGPVCEAVHKHITSLSDAEFEDAFGMYFQWTNNATLFLSVLDTIKSLNDAKISMSIMKMSSCLERSLGDVYLTVGKNCPFLLRDLLASSELVKVFSEPVMNILRIFLGSPESLNLRNILWHGFASPHEIPHKYCSILLLLTVGLGQIIETYFHENKLSLEHRPYFVFHNLEKMCIFPDLYDEELSVAEKLIEKSKFVLQHMKPFWIEAISAFRQRRYADCIILLLPQLETGLRLIFTIANKCPYRMLTAESAHLYTTFDEILAKQVENEFDNQVPQILGEPTMEFLWDFLNHQEGPRVRDHLSHGEIQLNKFPREVANQLLCFTVVLLSKHLETEHVLTQDTSTLQPLIAATECYMSRFHPIALLQNQLLQCCESLRNWPIPSLSYFQQVTGCGEMSELGVTFIHEITYILSLLQLQKDDRFHIDDINSWLLTEKWFNNICTLCSIHIHNLYCHRRVLEAVGVLRKVVKQCILVSDNVLSISEARYKQWLDKTLRSRQRQNYLRMLSSIKALSLVLGLIVTLMVLDLHNIYKIAEQTPLEYNKYLRYAKSILQYTENLSTCTSVDKNRWNEAIELSQKNLLQIRIFIEKIVPSHTIQQNRA
ncbi:endoplasmic reticulum membrane-associated RNA degradation protein isoform X2 [Spea bombifrons]|uniref:endoplasmic reticulum membrane-associated RNA degradation protein isoform X2 n=1 Tax=Spea bombifrons TaxID=233779 RepID=UPI002349EC14|nr:endoplasmic reticulum membrane-associated RNA degradation protein isoform X2 [Spea bombifrons]